MDQRSSLKLGAGEQPTRKEQRPAAADAPRWPDWLVTWPIARAGLKLVLRRKLFWGLLGLALLHFLFLFASVYLKAQLTAEHPGLAPFIERILDAVSGDGRMYRDFMFAQGTVTMLLLGLAGETLIGNDFRQGGLIFYLSRRVARWHYLAGKLLAAGALVWLTTAIPALVLFFEYGLLTDSFDYILHNGRIVLGILGYGLAMSIPLGLLLFALAAWLQRTVPLLMAWASVFLLLPVVGAMLREVHDDRRWLLLLFWRNIRLLGSWCFGSVEPRDAPLLLPAAVIVAAVCVACLVVAIRRVQAVRVVA